MLGYGCLMNKKNIAIFGLGHIGKYIKSTLESDNRFAIYGFDLKSGVDLSNESTIDDIVSKVDGVIAATPFFLNKKIATSCAKHSVAYFDLTESNEVAEHIKNLNASVPMVSQCGLAPGMVSVIANSMTSDFKEVKSIAIRVGALPSAPNNQMGYLLTWNTEGLINEYIHPCKCVSNGKFSFVEPLDGIEPVNFNGIQLEAANTSGGIGSLAETWENRAESITYKTLRYPGHWSYMKFLKDDLKLKENFSKFVEIFNSSIPHTTDDRVFIMIKVTGLTNDNELLEKSYTKIIEDCRDVTAIQISTGSGIMAVVDAWANGSLANLSGLVKQEDLPAKTVLNSVYASCYWVP